MISTTYSLGGITSNDDVLQVRLRVSDVPHVGAVAIERVSDDEARMIIKHKDDVEPDREEIAAAVERAGGFTLA